MKKLTCRDIGVDCDVVFTGETVDDIMREASLHAAREHNLPLIPPHIEQKCRAAIVDISGTASPSEKEEAAARAAEPPAP